MALCRSLFVYLPDRPGAGAGVGALETARVGVDVPLPLVGAPGAPSASSSLPVGGGLLRGLRQVRGPAIFFGWIGYSEGIYQILIILPNRLADLLDLELLEL